MPNETLPSTSITQLESEYISKARKAFSESNLKLCLIYLKKLTVWDSNTTNLLVDCAYALWQSDYLVKFEENDALELVKFSFNRVVDGSIPPHFIRAIDYIYISHIYLIEGNLQGALLILNVASQRGYLEDALIVNQSLSIAKRIGRSRDIRDSMSYLVSAITLLSSQIPYSTLHEQIPFISDSKLPLSFVYLHCISYVLKLIALPTTNQVIKNTYKMQLKSMLIEAYLLHTLKREEDIMKLMAWINGVEVWMKMGQALDSTPYILFMIDCFWEAFIRSPLQIAPIELSMKYMLQYHMDGYVGKFLEDAIAVSPWNMLVRTEMVKYEYSTMMGSGKIPKWSSPSLNMMGKWTRLFEMQRKQCTKLQATYRGHLIRRQWHEVLLPRYQEKKKNFIRASATAVQKYDDYNWNYFCSLAQRWKDYIREYKALKQFSSVLIQSHVRRHLQQLIYQREVMHVKEVNGKYLTACYHVYCTRMWQYFQRWNAKFYHFYQIKAASILQSVIVAAGYNRVFVKGVQQLVAIHRIKKRFLYRLHYSHWLTRYQQRKKNHARITIRFFIRDVYKRLNQRQQEMKLKEMEGKLKSKHRERLTASSSALGDDESVDDMSVGSNTAVSHESRDYYKKHHYPVLHSHFMRWRAAYLKHMHTRLLNKAVMSIQCKFRQQVAQEIVHYKLIRKQSQTAYCTRRKFLAIARIFRPWYKLSKILLIQRNVRCYQARKQLERLSTIYHEIKSILSRKYSHVRLRYFEKWQKFLYLQHREQLRAKNCIVKYYRYYKQFYSPFKRLYLHRYFVYVFKETVKTRILGHAFHTFKLHTLEFTRYQSINGVFNVFSRYYCRHGFFQWLAQSLDQKNVSVWLTRKNARMRKEVGLVQNQQVVQSDAEVSTYGLCSIDRKFQGMINMTLHDNSAFNIELNIDSIHCPEIQKNHKQYQYPVNKSLQQNISYSANYPWERTMYRQKVLARISHALLYRYLFQWHELYRVRQRISYLNVTSMAVSTYQNILTGLTRRSQFLVRVQANIRRYIAFHSIYLPLLALSRRASELQTYKEHQIMFKAFRKYSTSYQERSNAKECIVNFIYYYRQRQFRQQTTLRHRTTIQFLCSYKSKFYCALMKKMFIKWIQRSIEQIIRQKVTTSNYIARYEKLQQAKFKPPKVSNKKKMRKNNQRPLGLKHHDEDNEDEMEEEEEDEALSRLAKIEQYQQNLLDRKHNPHIERTTKVPPNESDDHQAHHRMKSEFSKSMPSFASPYANTAMMSNTVAQGDPVKHKNIRDSTNMMTSLSLTPLYFQSEAFHTLYYQLKSTQGLLIIPCETVYIHSSIPTVAANASIVSSAITHRSRTKKKSSLNFRPPKNTSNNTITMAIALQESYFLFQQTHQLAIQLPSLDHSCNSSNNKDLHLNLLFQSVCESFQGEKLFFYQGEFQDVFVTVYLLDFLSCNREKFYSLDKFLKSCWPLTLPVTTNNTLSSGKIVYEDSQANSSSSQGKRGLILHFQEVSIPFTTMILFCHVIQYHKSPCQPSQFVTGKLFDNAALNSTKPTVSSSLLLSSHCYLGGIQELKMDIQSTGLLGLLLLIYTTQVG